MRDVRRIATHRSSPTGRNTVGTAPPHPIAVRLAGARTAGTALTRRNLEWPSRLEDNDAPAAPCPCPRPHLQRRLHGAEPVVGAVTPRRRPDDAGRHRHDAADRG